MARIEVTTHVAAPPSALWRVLTAWERQAEWMVDVRRIAVAGDRREGVGTRVSLRTDILGVSVRDDLVVSEWEPPTLLGVQHVGRPISGVGAFELTASPSGTVVVWWEEVRVPLGGVGDAVADLAVMPWVRRTFRHSLARLKRLAEAESPAVGS